MAQDPREYMQRLQRAIQQRGQGGFGGGLPSGGAAGRGLFGLIALGVGATILSNSLFNVDGGHRAIKYTRVGGVKKEIYAEGSPLPSSTALASLTDL